MAILGFACAETADTLESVQVSGTAGAVTTHPHSGGSCFRINPVAGVGRLVFKGFDATGNAVGATLNSPTLYASAWLYITAAPTAKIRCLTFANGTKVQGGFYLNTDGSVSISYFNTSDTLIDLATSAPLATGTWHLLEAKFAVVQTAGSSSVEGKLNSAVLGSGAALTITSAPANVQSWAFGDAAVSSTHDIFFDDGVIDDAAYPGPCSVAALVPNGAGQAAAWTGGTSSDFNAVKEVDGSHANDGDTTYLKSQASGDIHSLTHTALPASATTIKSVIAWMIARDEGGVTSWKVGVGDYNTFSTETTNGDPGATYVYRAVLANVDPATGAAWLPAAVNTAQIYISNNSNVASRVTAMGLFVVYATPTSNFSPGRPSSPPQQLGPRGLAPQRSGILGMPAAIVDPAPGAEIQIRPGWLENPQQVGPRAFRPQTPGDLTAGPPPVVAPADGAEIRLSMAPQRTGAPRAFRSLVQQPQPDPTGAIYVAPLPGAELKPSPAPQQSTAPFTFRALRQEAQAPDVAQPYAPPLPGAEIRPSQAPQMLGVRAFRPQQSGDQTVPLPTLAPAPGADTPFHLTPQMLGPRAFAPQKREEQAQVTTAPYVAPLPGAELIPARPPQRTGTFAFRPQAPGDLTVPAPRIEPFPGAETPFHLTPQMGGPQAFRGLQQQPQPIALPAIYIAPLPGAEIHLSMPPQRNGVFAFRSLVQQGVQPAPIVPPGPQVFRRLQDGVGRLQSPPGSGIGRVSDVKPGVGRTQKPLDPGVGR